MVTMPRVLTRKAERINYRESALVLRRRRVIGEDFSGRRLDHFSAESVYFERCRFDGAVIDDVGLGAGRRDSRYVDCTFDGARMRWPAPGRARLERCLFRDVRITEFFCLTVEMVDCVFSGTVERGRILGMAAEEERMGLRRRSNEIRGNDFSGLRMIDIGFSAGVDLTAQKLPAGPGYVYIPDFPAAVQRAREYMLSVPDPEFRRRASIFIQMWEETVEGGQKQQLFRRGDFSASRHPEFHRLLDVMTSEL